MMTAITAITAEDASIPAKAAPPVPGGSSPAVGPGDLYPLEPVHAQPVQPILFGDFDANGDGVRDKIILRMPDLNDTYSRIGIVTGEGSVMHVIRSEQPTDLFGVVARSAGDVNNDGYDDVIANTQRWDKAAGAARSFVSVYSGKSGSLLYKFIGEADFDSFGLSAAPAGDVNGDGFDDILVGSPDGGANSDGYVHVLSGADGSLLRAHHGEIVGNGYGAAVTGLGDIDEDGRADYAMSSPSSKKNSTGFVYIYSGATGSLVRTVASPQAVSSFGLTISASDDLDGDGKAELFVDAPFVIVDIGPSGFIDRMGRAYIYSPTTGGLLSTMTGSAGMTFGATRGTAIDFDGDGTRDLIATESDLRDPANMMYMHSVFISGATGRVLVDFNMANSSPSLTRDLNSDGVINAGDISVLLRSFNTSATTSNATSDINNDGWIDATDLMLIADDFGDHAPSLPTVAGGLGLCGGAALAAGGLFGLGLLYCTGNAIGCYLFKVCFGCFDYLFNQGAKYLGIGVLGACAVGVYVIPF